MKSRRLGLGVRVDGPMAPYSTGALSIAGLKKISPIGSRISLFRGVVRVLGLREYMHTRTHAHTQTRAHARTRTRTHTHN